MDFDQTWTTIKEIILKNFAGDPVEGVPSPSVQNTIYLSQKDILAAIKEVSIVHDIAIFPSRALQNAPKYMRTQLSGNVVINFPI